MEYVRIGETEVMRWVDTVVLSLPADVERRAHISQHFQDIGITNYRFFDALGPSDAQVVDAFKQGRVKAYPD